MSSVVRQDRCKISNDCWTPSSR